MGVRGAHSVLSSAQEYLSIIMRVQVKNILTKSRNPSEHKFDVRNKIGECVQVVGDGFCLIEFNFTIERKGKREKLQWYIHDTDFFIKQ